MSASGPLLGTISIIIPAPAQNTIPKFQRIGSLSPSSYAGRQAVEPVSLHIGRRMLDYDSAVPMPAINLASSFLPWMLPWRAIMIRWAWGEPAPWRDSVR